MSIYFTIVFLLLGAHFLVDYSIQGEAVALGKNKYIDPCKFGVNWQYWMLGHAFSHGFLVALCTQNAYLGLAETIFHFMVDWAKCAKLIGIHADQILHFISKLVWAGICYMLYFAK